MGSQYFEKDGIIYLLTAERKSNQCWYGGWTCCTCVNASGESNRACDNENSAFESARFHLQTHHYIVHKS